MRRVGVSRVLQLLGVSRVVCGVVPHLRARCQSRRALGVSRVVRIGRVVRSLASSRRVSSRRVSSRRTVLTRRFVLLLIVFPFFRFPPSHVVLNILVFSSCTDASFRAVLTSLFVLLSILSFLRFDFFILKILRYDTR